MKQKSRITIGHVFKTIIRPRRKIVFVGLVLIVISRLASLVLPGATKYLMDDVIAKADLQMLKYLLIAGLVATYLNPTSGTITVDGTDLSKVNLESYRRQLGVVLQDDFLFEGTIRENILFPRPGASPEELNRAVHAAYVHEFSDRFENGLDTVIGSGASNCPEDSDSGSRSPVRSLQIPAYFYWMKLPQTSMLKVNPLFRKVFRHS